jgi:hypothetical protein
MSCQQMNLMVMNLQNKIDIQFTGFTINPPDPKNDHPWHLEHLHADFIELLALLRENDSYITLQDTITYYKDYEFDIDFEESNLVEDSASSNVSEKNDKWQTTFREIFYVIEERVLVYDVNYPFEVDGLKIKLKNNLNEPSKLYLYLLISSNLNNFKKVNSILTSEFEKISKLTLESYLPNLEVEEFGQNSQYIGNTINKIKALSIKLNITTRVNEINQISTIANKEKGLDIVGWQSFSDSISNMVIILGQCACGKNWVNKKGDTSEYEDSYLDFHKLKPIHAMFIPYGLVKHTKTFFQSNSTNGRLLFERKRILELMINKMNDFKDLQSYKIVTKCIEYDIEEV